MKSLLGQNGLEKVSWELLLIDNNSSDTTPDVVKNFEAALPLRYVFEGAQGLSAARNRALQEFRGDILIFTDDDVVLDPSWLAVYDNALNQFPEADYFGGRILPLWQDDKPNWLRDPSMALISGLLGHYDLGKNNRWFRDDDPLPFGANFALRRELGERMEPFRLDLGVKGGSSGRGEEAEYLGRVQRTGAKGAYVGTAVAYHAQDSRRFKVGFLYRYGIEKGRAAALMSGQAGGSNATQLLFAVRGLGQLLRGRGDRFRQCIINMGIQRGLTLERARSQATRQ